MNIHQQIQEALAKRTPGPFKGFDHFNNADILIAINAPEWLKAQQEIITQLTAEIEKRKADHEEWIRQYKRLEAAALALEIVISNSEGRAIAAEERATAYEHALANIVVAYEGAGTDIQVARIMVRTAKSALAQYKPKEENQHDRLGGI